MRKQKHLAPAAIAEELTAKALDASNAALRRRENSGGAAQPGASSGVADSQPDASSGVADSQLGATSGVVDSYVCESKCGADEVCDSQF